MARSAAGIAVTWSYLLHGLQVQSALRLPIDPVAGDFDRADVQVERVPALDRPIQPDRVRRVQDVGALELGFGTDGKVLGRLPDDTRFRVSSDGSVVEVAAPVGATEADSATYVISTIMGLVLERKRQFALHASALVVHDRAWAFVGQAGAGKSTMAVCMLNAGHPVLADDIAVVTPTLEVVPGPALVKLWPDSAEALCRARDMPTMLAPPWPKRGLRLRDGEHGRAAIPLQVVIVLDEAEDIEVEVLSGQAAAIALTSNVYAADISKHASRAWHLDRIASLVNSVPVMNLRRPRRFENIVPAMVSRILQALQELEYGNDHD